MLRAHVAVYNLDGSLAYEHETKLTAAADVATNLGPIDFPATRFGMSISSSSNCATPQANCFRAISIGARRPNHPDDLTALNQTADGQADRDRGGAERKRARRTQAARSRCTIPTKSIALMAHVQLRRKSGERVLPVFYSDNYVSLVPGETKTIEIEAAASAFKGEARWSSSMDGM